MDPGDTPNLNLVGFRPSEAEKKLILAFMAEHDEFGSVARLTRVATMRMVAGGDSDKLTAVLIDAIDDARRAAEKLHSIAGATNGNHMESPH